MEIIYEEFEGEYRTPGYWIDEEARIKLNMCPICGERLEEGKCPSIEEAIHNEVRN